METIKDSLDTTICLSMFGFTKCSKTSTLAILWKYPKFLLEISSKGDFRSRIPYRVDFDENAKNEEDFVELSEFVLNYHNLYELFLTEEEIQKNDPNDQKNQERKVTRKMLKETTGIKFYTGEKNSINGSLSHYKAEEKRLKEKFQSFHRGDFARISSQLGIEHYISRMVIKVKPTEKLNTALLNEKIDLQIWDSIGLLDTDAKKTMEEQAKASLKNTSNIVKSGVDANLFFTIPSELPEAGSTYEESISLQLSSSPTFFIHGKANEVNKSFKCFLEGNSIEGLSHEEKEEIAKNYLSEKKSGNLGIDFDDIFEMTLPTYRFLHSMGAMVKKEEEYVDYVLPNAYFSEEESHYPLPLYATGRSALNNLETILESQEGILWKECVINAIVSISKKTKSYKDAKNKEQLKDALALLCKEWPKETLRDDFSRYNNHPNSASAPRYFSPKPTKYSKEKAITQLNDKTFNILGENKGIHGHPLALLFARSYFKVLYHTYSSGSQCPEPVIKGLIQELDFSKMHSLASLTEKEKNLIRMTLLKFLKDEFSDYTSYNYQSLTNRTIVEECVESVREKMEDNPLEYEEEGIIRVMDGLLNSFYKNFKSAHNIKSAE